jgi:hypothetical protein
MPLLWLSILLLAHQTGYFDVYCTFRGSTLVCLLVGLILLYGLQISGDLQVTTLDQHRVRATLVAAVLCCAPNGGAMRFPPKNFLNSTPLFVPSCPLQKRMAPWQTYPEDVRFHKNRKPKYDSDRDDKFWYQLPRARNSRRITVILIVMYFLGILMSVVLT